MKYLSLRLDLDKIPADAVREWIRKDGSMAESVMLCVMRKAKPDKFGEYNVMIYADSEHPEYRNLFVGNGKVMDTNYKKQNHE